MKPILFNTEMVKALLDGRKTVTRRVIKPQPKPEHPYPLGWVTDSTDNKNIGCFGWGQDEYGGVIDYAKPPCRTGDILYVRETYGTYSTFNGHSYAYKGDYIDFENSEKAKKLVKRWIPSIHMPREAARIFLRVTDVRVERLQEITEEQAVKEGVPADWPMDKVYCPICKGEGLIGAVHPVSLGFMEVECPHCEKGTSCFQNLWNSTIKPADLPLYGWDASPWVWVIEFERISKEDAYNA